MLSNLTCRNFPFKTNLIQKNLIVKKFFSFSFLKPSENNSLDFFDKVSRKTSFLTKDFSIYTYSADLSYPEKKRIELLVENAFSSQIGSS